MAVFLQVISPEPWLGVSRIGIDTGTEIWLG
jgi:hypothetical protein